MEEELKPLLFEVERNIGVSGWKRQILSQKEQGSCLRAATHRVNMWTWIIFPKKENFVDFVQEHGGDRQGRADKIMVSLQMQRAEG